MFRLQANLSQILSLGLSTLLFASDQIGFVCSGSVFICKHIYSGCCSNKVHMHMYATYMSDNHITWILKFWSHKERSCFAQSKGCVNLCLCQRMCVVAGRGAPFEIFPWTQNCLGWPLPIEYAVFWIRSAKLNWLSLTESTVWDRYWTWYVWPWTKKSPGVSTQVLSLHITVFLKGITEQKASLLSFQIQI